MTTEDDGLVLYQGPITELSEGDAEDFVILEMKNGYPLLRVNLGSGETKLTVDGRDRHGVVQQSKLSDGHWHRVDIFTAGKVQRLHCTVSLLSCLRPMTYVQETCTRNSCKFLIQVFFCEEYSCISRDFLPEKSLHKFPVQVDLCKICTSFTTVCHQH